MKDEEEPPMKTKTVKANKATAVKGSRLLVAEVRRKLGVSRKVFARLTGISERTLATWEGGGKPDELGLRRVRETERFQARLAEVVQPEAIPEWLGTPNAAFDGLTPLEVIERGDIDRLWNMIFYLESGVAS
jgi:DNA-binding XRE family transcriptional regulator